MHSLQLYFHEPKGNLSEIWCRLSSFLCSEGQRSSCLQDSGPQVGPICRGVLVLGVACDERSDSALVRPLHPKLLRPLWLPLGHHAGKSSIRGTQDKPSLWYAHLGISKAKCRRFFLNSTSTPSSWLFVCVYVCVCLCMCVFVCIFTCTNCLLLYRLWLKIFTCWNYWRYLISWGNLALCRFLPQYE